MKPRLQRRVPNLNAIPTPWHQLYQLVDENDPSKGYELLVEPEQPADPEPTPGAPPSRNAARDRRDAIVGDLMRRLQIRPEAAEAATAFLRRVVQVTEADGELVETFRHPSGWRWPSSMPGRDFITDPSELVLRMSAADGFDDAWRLPAADPAKTEAERDFEDSEVLPRLKRNVRVAKNCTQAEFEHATAEAQRRGGVVLYDESLDPPPAPPSLGYRPGRDVPVARGCTQAEFELAFELAQAQGGEVRIIE